MNYYQRKYIKKVKKAYIDYWYLNWYEVKRLLKSEKR